MQRKKSKNKIFNHILGNITFKTLKKLHNCPIGFSSLTTYLEHGWTKYIDFIHILIRRMLLFDTKIALFKWKKV